MGETPTPCAACWLGNHFSCEPTHHTAAGTPQTCTCHEAGHPTTRRRIAPTVAEQLTQIAEELTTVADALAAVATKLDSVDRNARAYGWAVGRGHPLTSTIDGDDTNPFLDPDWRTHLKDDTDAT